MDVVVGLDGIHGKNRHPSTVSFSAVGTVVNSSVTTSTTASQLYPSPELSDLDCELNVYSPNVENVSTPSQGHQEQEQEQDPQTSSWSPLATFWTPPSSPSSPSLFYTPPETPDRLESNHGTSLSGSVSPAAATIGYQTSPYSSTNDNESVELPSRLHLRLSFPYDACPHYSFLDDLHDEPPYEPVDLNSLNPELDPNDDQYYVESPVYRYVQDSETDMIRDPRNAYWNRITPGASPMETPLPGLLPQLGSFHSDEESIHQNPATPGLSSPRTPLPRLRPCLPWLSVSDDHWMEDMDDEPPYFPVDRNALYQDVDPDDDRYYVDEPVYQYVRESDSEVNSIYHENDENMFDCMYDHDRFFFEQRSLSPGYVPSDPYSDKDL
ncbi:hypothetical protein EMPS_03771 [Entomortierella parvispora]|uniref:Uncharacterized protein n=1 Tax=Entomortierella parvispora TaxID=205924 RepID=A0A9P3H797_9FUNG|nr:hypothetical protein EMPS_03771 [Entomortierella parvispora]